MKILKASTRFFFFFFNEINASAQVFGFYNFEILCFVCAVRCLIMESFLQMAWEKHDAHKVPTDFVFGPLLRGLNDVVHHKDFGQFEL